MVPAEEGVNMELCTATARREAVNGMWRVVLVDADGTEMVELIRCHDEDRARSMALGVNFYEAWAAHQRAGIEAVTL